MNPIDAINQLITQTATNIPVPTLPSLDLALPSGTDLDAKWREFLDRAAKDPDIVNYYQNLLDQAKGDTKLAVSFIEKDYQVGTRQESDILTATLEKLGLTSGQEQEQLADTLNQRGIALTEDNGKITYAGGGRAATELGNLNTAQRLRKEAEERSARQNIETAGLTREKGITEAGQGLTQTAQTLGKAKQQDILGRGQQYYDIYQNKITSDAQQKMNQQATGVGPSGQSTTGTGEKPPYKPDTVNHTVEYGGRTWRGQPGGDWY